MLIAVAGGTGTVGRHVVARAKNNGHDVVVLSRSNGVDLAGGTGLANALAGVNAVIDVTNPGTTEQDAATRFFTAVARNLQQAAAEQGIGQIVTLSIVGIDHFTTGYYVAKQEQERAALAGPVPATILRATQFHEFPAQLLGWTRQNGVAHIPGRRVQTVAARTVADVLVGLAEGEPQGRAGELAGPRESDLVTLARTFARRRALDIEVLPAQDDQSVIPQGGDIPDEALLPGDGARIAGPDFEEWLASDDALSLPV